MLLLLPQRYKFSSKSQLFFAPCRMVRSCCCYHKGTNFQANHNTYDYIKQCDPVVVATTKVQIFKQITTAIVAGGAQIALLLLPQRYKFSSKSQPSVSTVMSSVGCCCYHKGTNFQANHNAFCVLISFIWLLLLPQRYKFSSKSQLVYHPSSTAMRCCCYHKGTNFQANHNQKATCDLSDTVVVATTKVQIFKQITTSSHGRCTSPCCCCYHKGTNFQANHNTWSARPSA